MKYQAPTSHIMHSSFLLASQTFVPDGVIGFRTLANDKRVPNFVVTGLRGVKYFIGFNAIPAFLYSLKNLIEMDINLLRTSSFSISSNLILRGEKTWSEERGETYRIMLMGTSQFSSGVILARGKSLDDIVSQISKIISWVEKCVAEIKDKSVGGDVTVESVSSVVSGDFKLHLAFHSNKGGDWYAVGERKNKDGTAISLSSDMGVVVFKDDFNRTNFKKLTSALKELEKIPLTQESSSKIDIDPERSFYVVGKTDLYPDERLVKINCDDRLYISSLIVRETPKRFPLKALIAKMEEMLK